MTVKIKKNLEISERNNAMDFAAVTCSCLALVFFYQFEVLVPRVKIEFYFWSQRESTECGVKSWKVIVFHIVIRHQYKFDLISSM